MMGILLPIMFFLSFSFSLSAHPPHTTLSLVRPWRHRRVALPHCPPSLLPFFSLFPPPLTLHLSLKERFFRRENNHLSPSLAFSQLFHPSYVNFEADLCLGSEIEKSTIKAFGARWWRSGGFFDQLRPYSESRKYSLRTYFISFLYFYRFKNWVLSKLGFLGVLRLLN